MTNCSMCNRETEFGSICRDCYIAINSIKITSATKHDATKPRTDLLPTGPLLELARVYTFGAKKYGDNNWRRGMAWGRFYGATLRHLWAWWGGERLDPESGLPHLAHAAFGLFALMEYEEKSIGEDDRPR